MRVRLLKHHQNKRPGTEFVPGWEAQARELIRRGIAVEVVRGAPVAGPEPAGEAEPTAAEATAGQPAEKPKALKLKPAKKPKAPKPKK